MSQTATFLNNELYEYYLEHTLRPRPFEEALFNETKHLQQARMQTALEQTQLMQSLIKLTGAKRAIDVGVFTGGSSLAMALALPADGEVIACDINEEWTQIAKKHWQKAQVDHKVTLKIANAEDTLQQLIEEGENENFDFSYIDANKSSYTRYYEQCLALTKPNGLILIDNAFMGGKVLDNNTTDSSVKGVQKLNDLLKVDERVDHNLLPIGDGLSLIRKR